MRSSFAILWILVVGCQDANLASEAPAFHPRLPVAGKADGSGWLPEQEVTLLAASIDRVIAAGEREVGVLEAEIARLEAANAATVAEADRVVASIAARERELRDEHDRNLILCGLIPNPETCLIANLLANDRVLSDYRAQLAAAQREQQRVHEQLTDYEARRADLRGEIDRVRETKQRLLVVLRGETPRVVPVELRASVDVASDYAAATAGVKLTEIIDLEIALLTELRDAAASLGAALDDAVDTLRALDASVEALVGDSRERFMDALVELVTGDPAAHAEALLEDEIAGRTRALLASLDWPARLLVEHMLGHADADGDDADPLGEVAALETALLQVLDERPSGTTTYTVPCTGTPAAFVYYRLVGVGHGSGWTARTMPDLRLTRVRVHVRVRHPNVAALDLGVRVLGTTDVDTTQILAQGAASGADIDQWFLVAPLEGEVMGSHELLSVSIGDHAPPAPGATAPDAALESCAFELTGHVIE